MEIIVMNGGKKKPRVAKILGLNKKSGFRREYLTSTLVEDQGKKYRFSIRETGIYEVFVPWHQNTTKYFCYKNGMLRRISHKEAIVIAITQQ